MNVRILRLTQQEIDEAVAWFDAQVEGKGTEFLDEFDRVIRRVKAYPFASTQIEPDIRKCLFAHFPYSLIFGVEEQTIVVIAVAHHRRTPRYWIDRVESD